ncbi:hypothetical protein QF031_002958 [Pseudarthrobacter defluvii]|nr:hypothetical protein [Pseudarthrobacter defluvii]
MDRPGARHEFIVVSGEAAGNRLVIPRGEVTVGSQDGSLLRLPVYAKTRRNPARRLLWDQAGARR